MKSIAIAVGAIVLLASLTSPAPAHCEIPCGIYDDEAKFRLAREHVTTIEKSIRRIVALSKEDDLNYNQIVRWIQNKEKHAGEIQRIVTRYFMTQRLKPVNKEDKKAHSAYIEKLELLHGMLVYAMKAKQTTDLATVEKIRSLLAEFEAQYFGKHEH